MSCVPADPLEFSKNYISSKLKERIKGYLDDIAYWKFDMFTKAGSIRTLNKIQDKINRLQETSENYFKFLEIVDSITPRDISEANKENK